MSMHYSKHSLNTYRGTPYFRAHVSEDYPVGQTLQKCRAFRRLPPNLQTLSALAKEWAIRNNYPQGGIDEWYDEEGYELNPFTKERLTDAQIDAEWGNDPSLDDFVVEDIPIPDGGFADPSKWEEPEEEEDIDEDADRPTEDQVLSDIAARGREYTGEYYGVSKERLATIKNDQELARAILGR